VYDRKEVQAKLAKGLLDIIVLQNLRTKPMHGYQMITQIRKSFGVYFGPSSIYPLMAQLEQKGYIRSEWNVESERPRKVYKLTSEGLAFLNFTENSFNLLCQKIGASSPAADNQTQAAIALQPPKKSLATPMIKR
jgi:PadR family transcriptional regulator